MLNVTAAVRRAADFIDRWHWVLLLLAAPLLAFPSPSRSLVLLIVPGLWLAAWLVRRDALPRTPLNGTLLLLSLMMLVSVFVTYDVEVSLPKIAGMVLGFGAFFGVVRVSHRPQGWWLSLAAFLALGVGMAGLGLLGTKWLLKFGFLTPIVSRLPARITGLPGAEEGLSANQLAGALLWVMPVLLTFAVFLVRQFQVIRLALGRTRTLLLIVVMMAATTLVGGMIVLTQSRSGYIGFAVGGAMLALAGTPARWRRLLWGGLIVVAVVAVMVVWQQGARTGERQMANGADAGNSGLSTDTFDFRLQVWSRAFAAIQDFPFTGMGMNTFRHIVPVLYPLVTAGPDYDIAHAHNEFLQAALDLGLLGLVGFLALYMGAFWMLRQVWLLATRSKFRPLVSDLQLLTCGFQSFAQTWAVGLGVGLFAHMVYGLTDAVALGAKPGILFWMLLGLIVGLYEQTRSGSGSAASGGDSPPNA